MMNLQTYKTVTVPAHRSYWHGATSNTYLKYNLLGPKGLGKHELCEAPSNLLSSIFLNIEKQQAQLTLKYFEHLREILPHIVKKTSIYGTVDPITYGCFRQFYSDNQIQELLQKINTFSTQILIDNPKAASKLLRIGLKIAAGLPNDSLIEFQLKRQYGLIQILQERSDDELINSYEQLLFDALKQPEVVPPSEIAAIKSHLGCIHILKGLIFSGGTSHRKEFDEESGIKFYQTLEIAESFFEEAIAIDPENTVYKINKLVLEALVVGMHVYQPFYYVSFSEAGIINLLPTLLRNLAISGRDNLSNVTVYRDLVKLHKAEIKKALNKQNKVLLLNQREQVVLEKPQKVEQLLIESNKKQSRKKRTGE